MTSRSLTVNLKPTVWDGVVVAAVIAMSVLVAAVFYGNKANDDKLTAVVSVGNKVVDSLPLFEGESVHTYSNNGYTLQVTVTDHGVCVQESNCPTQDCVHTGIITRNGQSIVCLPAQIVIHLKGADLGAPDAVVG